MNEKKLSNKFCALYLRSSKDRTDVSIDAQRRELHDLAKSRDLIVLEEFTDAVESGKDSNRPGFQKLLLALKAGKDRSWATIMMVDTSRLARNQYVAHSFMHDCDKVGIKVIFAKTPELDGVTGIILPAVLHAMDQVHSFMSKEKGLAGMAENVRQGYRAGGRAPYGYKLQHIATGAIRDGEPVTKSKLVRDGKNADLIAAFLKGRAVGKSRTAFGEELKIKLPVTTLHGIEWNALTYAGHTVWNVHNEFSSDGGYKGGFKRRPRDEWLMQRNTHEALITDAEAETILTKLSKGKRETQCKPSNYLLTGILETPDGKRWEGDNGYYRTKLEKGSKSIKTHRIDEVVVRSVSENLRSDVFAEALVAQAHADAKKMGDKSELDSARKEFATIDVKMKQLLELVTEVKNHTPILRQIEELETRREAAILRVTTAETGVAQRGAFERLDMKAARNMLDTIADLADNALLDESSLKMASFKELLRSLLKKIILHPADFSMEICYQISPATRVVGASPGVCFDNPCLPLHIELKDQRMAIGKYSYKPKKVPIAA